MQNKYKNTFFKEKLNKLPCFLFSPKFAKTVLNYLFIALTIKVLIVGALFLIPEKTAVLASSPIDPSILIYLTNQERSKHNLEPLVENELLTKAAYNKALDIIKNDYFAHTTPYGKRFFEWIQEAGYKYRSAGENLAISFKRNTDIVNAWMNSKTHRENILDPYYKEIGIAKAEGEFNGKTTIIVVQMFGEPIKNTGYVIQNIKNSDKLSIKYSKPLNNKNNLTSFVNYINKTTNISIIALSLMLIIILFERAIQSQIKNRI